MQFIAGSVFLWPFALVSAQGMRCWGPSRAWRLSWATAVAAALLAMETLVLVQADELTCWKVQTVGSVQTVLATSSGLGCAVNVTLPLYTGTIAPEAYVSATWDVELLAKTETLNALNMANPPDATMTLAPDNAGEYVQIMYTYLRVCSSQAACTPTAALDLASAPQSGNFSTAGDTALFSSINEVQLSTAGTYVLAAQVQIGDADDSTVAYYFTAVASVVVEKDAQEAIVPDKTTTRCRRSLQSALATLGRDTSVDDSTSCEIGIAVESDDVAPVGSAVAVNWTVSLTQDSNKEIQLPSPLIAETVTGDGEYYEIVNARLTICQSYTYCDEYLNTSATLDILQPETPWANFSSSTAKFAVKNLKFDTAGLYYAFAHVVLAGASDSRYDAMTYFEILATVDDQATETENADYSENTNTTYCWEIMTNSEQVNVTETSIATMGQGTSCPYSMAMSLSASTMTVNESLTIDWQMTQRTNYSLEGFQTLNLTTTNDEVPQSNLYYCVNTTAACTPFSSDKTLLYSAGATNFTDGLVSFSASKLSFSSHGAYVIVAHTVVPQSDYYRLDLAVLATIRVNAASSGADAASSSDGGSSLTIMWVAIALAVLIVGGGIFGVVFVKRRRRLNEARGTPSYLNNTFKGFRQDFRSHEPTDSQERSPSMIRSDDSGLFSYVRAAPSPIEDHRPCSLSYDPESQHLVPKDLSMDELGYSFAFPENERPSILPPQDSIVNLERTGLSSM